MVKTGEKEKSYYLIFFSFHYYYFIIHFFTNGSKNLKYRKIPVKRKQKGKSNIKREKVLYAEISRQSVGLGGELSTHTHELSLFFLIQQNSCLCRSPSSSDSLSLLSLSQRWLFCINKPLAHLRPLFFSIYEIKVKLCCIFFTIPIYSCRAK